MSAEADRRAEGVGRGTRVLVCPRRRGPVGGGSAHRSIEDLRRAGWDAAMVAQEDALAAGADATILLRGSAPFFRRLLDELGRRPAAERPHVVLWHYEPLPPPSASPFSLERPPLRELVKLALRDENVVDPRHNLRALVAAVGSGVVSAVAATSLGKVETLAEHGVAAAFVPAGGGPPEDAARPVERDLGVVFLGELRIRRRRRAVARLRRSGVEVTTLGSFHRRGLWGERRREVLFRTRILLNLSRHPGDLAGSRLSLGMRHGAAVVSEPIYRPDPYVPGLHYAEAPLEELPGVIQRLLQDETERLALVDAANDLMRRHTAQRSVDLLGPLLRPETAAPLLAAQSRSARNEALAAAARSNGGVPG